MTNQLLEKFNQIKTPFYYYDVALLRETLDTIKKESGKYNNFVVHYALKANANDKILDIVNEYGLGADCVSGNEVKRVLDRGFNPSKIAFAGVGKTDEEINLGLDHDIFSFNVESIPELEVINELAEKKNTVANIAFRINPNVDAKTFKQVTTGTAENKFGISAFDFEILIEKLKVLKHVRFVGLHFHIGSQITDLSVYKELCVKVEEFQQWFEEKGYPVNHINVGGGLGVDYTTPKENPVPDFATYFKIFNDHLNLRPNQSLHFELGRSVVGHVGDLITKVLYVKKGMEKNFAIVDAGFTELLRPALYQAHHFIENISSQGEETTYDVVGPICESSDFFDKDVALNEAKRGDLLKIHTAGAYGEIMASQYNLRDMVKAYYSDEI